MSSRTRVELQDESVSMVSDEEEFTLLQQIIACWRKESLS